ncbi:acyltransferase family protein, partial [Bradyrhizobium sp. CSA207]|uniref:acyltransferase family protein n=1 Tax=Bradyrhizobium sp. CSA207 TaxID=2698826 RepID=UPI0023B1F75B
MAGNEGLNFLMQNRERTAFPETSSSNQMQSATLQTRHSFLALDMLRGVAALAVMTRHTSSLFGGQLFPMAYLAVDFFFMLSGFVLAHAYGRQLGKSLSFRAFMVARLIRLYPLYLLGLLVTCLALGIATIRGGGVSLLAWLIWLPTALLFLPAPGHLNSSIFPLNGPTWSLFFELVVNAALGAWFQYFSLRLLFTIIGISGLGLICSAGLIGTIDVGFQWATFPLGFLRVAPSFFGGWLLYMIWQQRRTTLANWAALVAACCLITTLAINPSHDVEAALAIVTIAVAFPAIIYLAAASSITNPVLSRGSTWLGASSYAIYVLHLPAYRKRDFPRTLTPALLTDGLRIGGGVWPVQAVAVLGKLKGSRSV